MKWPNVYSVDDYKKMKYFTEEYLNYFKELASNNNKPWFDENKQRFEKYVKQPFEFFVADLIEELAKKDKRLSGLMPKDAIFRIYKDVRFSKDKTPYKIQMSAVIAEGGKKSLLGGMYFEFGPEHVRFYMGIYSPEKEQLNVIRTGIANHPDQFEQLISDEKFKKMFGEIRGEKNAKLPVELKDAGSKQPLIFNKQFYYFTQLEPEVLLSEKLMETAEDAFITGQPLSDYLFGFVRHKS